MYWFIKLCEGFEYFHSKNIIHRDIKPENLFITSDKKVKIGDFGVARILKPKEVADTFVGTLGYIAPEVSFGKGYDQKADIWSLGCILFEAATMRLISDVTLN
jgi:NIMA (never in mitosis gene a)-related kinase